MTDIEGLLYFSANSQALGQEPWTSNGTDEGTENLDDIEVGVSPSNPGDFALLDGKVFFRATDDTHGTELWYTDLPKGEISGRYWDDLDGDGIQDPGETDGFAGKEVKLKNASTHAEVASTTTGADGSYSFIDVDFGEFYLEFTPLITGHPFSAQDKDDDDTVDSDVDVQTGKTDNFTLIPGQTLEHMDAGAQKVGISIEGFIWDDLNGEGIQDEGEAGLSDITVTLRKVSGSPSVASTFTDPSGIFVFTNLEEGSYQLEVLRPQDYEFSTPNNPTTTEELDSDVVSGATSSPGITQIFTLTNDEIREDIDVGLFFVGTSGGGGGSGGSGGGSGTASISGRAWDDANGDGLQDATETNGFSSIYVILHDSGRIEVDSTYTGADGSYSFSNLSDGNYSVSFTTIPFGYEFSPQDVGSDNTLDSDVDNTGATVVFNLSLGQIKDDIDAGLYYTSGSGGNASVSGQIFDDLNGDGIQNVGESGFGAGIPVHLIDALTSTILATAYTDQNGEYVFSNLVAGDYAIQVELPPEIASDYYFTNQDVGSDDTIDSDVDSNGWAYFTLFANENKDDLDAGLISAF